jgi:hypothetical protein
MKRTAKHIRTHITMISGFCITRGRKKLKLTLPSHQKPLAFLEIIFSFFFCFSFFFSPSCPPSNGSRKAKSLTPASPGATKASCRATGSAARACPTATSRRPYASASAYLPIDFFKKRTNIGVVAGCECDPCMQKDPGRQQVFSSYERVPGANAIVGGLGRIVGFVPAAKQ